MAGLGLRPISLSEKAAAPRPARRPRAAGGAGLALASRKQSDQGLRPRAGELHAPALEPAGRGRAAEPRAGHSLQGSLLARPPAPSGRKSTTWSSTACRWPTRWRKSPETFPRVYTAMVQAGETGGFLDLVLAQIADFQAREKELRSKVMTAMLYPSILLVLAIGVLIFLLTFFIPRFQGIFTGFGATLPLPTQIVIGASHVVRSYGAVRRWSGLVDRRRCCCGTGSPRRKGRRTWEGLMLRAPIVGPLVAQFAMARFCRMLGTLLGAGVPLVQGAERRAQIHRQPDPGGCGFAIHRAGAAGRPARRQPGATARACSPARCWR